ncbi:TPA: hydrogenase maturation peptidase HycI [Photobacterium damselae]|uniref:Hydrogenase maturation peptidase HycI n=2 Tax=Photobacterium damselae subsp. damselae TaxID=85581 RepID=A0AAD3ZX61_PHODD|nr:hydrogenase maturation peptidase HycI [Photobacterium damselae]KAB1184186.1 hydrogenase maturation peptidase HycI [Photobacterium damselae subsp. damselae]
MSGGLQQINLSAALWGEAACSNDDVDLTVDNILLTVGNSMMGDDGAGPLLATMLKANPIDNWSVLEGGSMPEDCLHLIRKAKPNRVLVVDAADIGEEAGTTRVIDPESIVDMYVVSTHSLPLNFLIDELKTFVPEVVFVGIQPAIVAFSAPLTEMVQNAVSTLYQVLPVWQGDGGFEHV